MSCVQGIWGYSHNNQRKQIMAKVHHHFDLFNFTSEVISPEVAAQMAQSVAWRIDIMIISAARSLYKDIREEQFNAGIDVRAELTLAMNKQAYSEQAFYEHGSSNVGPVSSIKELMYQREGWHALATDLTALTCDWKGQPKVYVAKTIEEQIFEPGQMKVGADTKRKLHMGAKRLAEAYDQPEEAENLYKRRLERSEQKMVDVGENLKTQAQGVCHMFDLAIRHPMNQPSGDTTMEFSSLSLDSQRTLIKAAATAAQRAEEWAADDRNMTDTDYDMICLSSIKAVKLLNAELKQPRFVVARQQQEAGEAMTG